MKKDTKKKWLLIMCITVPFFAAFVGPILNHARAPGGLGGTLLIGFAVFVFPLFFLARPSGKKNSDEEGRDKDKPSGLTGKRWVGIRVLAACLFACHLGLLFAFAPGILQGLGIAAFLVLLIPSWACWSLLFVLLARYKKRHYPVSQEIERLTHDKAPFFPPEPMVTIYREMKAIEEAVRSIREKNRITNGYIRLLKKNAGDPGAKILLEKQEEYDKYFNDHYAACCSAYLNVRFQFYITLIKEILIPGGRVYSLDIERFIDSIKDDLKSLRCMMTDNPSPGKARAMEGAEHGERGKPPARGKSDNGNDTVLNETGKTMAAINRKIRQITTYLIALQSHKTIAGTSPIDERNLLDIYSQEYDIEMDIKQVRQLEDEFNRFTAEKELSGL
jgi:hypothetical protein